MDEVLVALHFLVLLEAGEGGKRCDLRVMYFLLGGDPFIAADVDDVALLLVLATEAAAGFSEAALNSESLVLSAAAAAAAAVGPDGAADGTVDLAALLQELLQNHIRW